MFEYNDVVSVFLELNINAPIYFSDGKMESYTKYVKSMDDSIRHLFNVGESNIKKHTGGMIFFYFFFIFSLIFMFTCINTASSNLNK